MRHVTVLSSTYNHTLSGAKIPVNAPYDTQYTNQFYKDGFKSATPRKTYVKIIQYVYEHDGCRRRDILKGIGQYGGSACNGRGQLSTIFSQLLYLDLLDYDKNYNYHVGKNGMKVLENAYYNQMDKDLKGKA